jgi:hypothetical protein
MVAVCDPVLVLHRPLVCLRWQDRLLELFKNHQFSSQFLSFHLFCRSMRGPSSALLPPERGSAPTPNVPSLHNLDETSLLFIINHVFLPPALPAKSDRTPEHEASLIRVFKDCAETFARRFELQGNSRRAWDVISRMLSATALLHDRGIVEEHLLNEQIAGMEVGGEHSSVFCFRADLT